MRRLMLLRHAKSDRSKPGGRDRDRTVAPRGREAAQRIGAYMAGHGLRPDLVICSTAVRTRETWDLVASAFTKAPQVAYDERIYQNNPKILLDVVRETEPGVHVLLLVGHNPSFQAIAEFLTASGHGDARQRLREKFPTAGLAVIDFPVDAWDRVHPHSGRLDRLITPGVLEAAPD
jgi:phosphohistidine phosphatase